MRDETQVGASLTDMRHSTQVNDAPTIGFQHVSDYAVRFGQYVAPCPANANSNKPLYNSEITVTASILSKFDWAVYGFNNGHFHLTIIELGMPFNIVLACDPYANGRALFTEICSCPTILSSAPALLDHVRASGNTAPLTGYLIHSHRYTSTKPTHRSWDIQAHIVLQLHAIRSLSMVVAVVHPDHDCRAVGINFTQRLRSSGWVITDMHISFASYGDSVSGSCRLIIAVQSNTEENCGPLEIRTPPQLPSRPIARYIWAPFNRPEHAVSFSKNDKSFNNHAVNDNGLQPLRASIPSNAQQMACPDGVQVDYYLHRHDDNPADLVCSAVICVDGICPPFNPIANTNVFGHYFGTEYKCNGSTYVCAISTFEFVSCFRLTNKLTYALSHPSNAFCLDATVPALTLARIFEIILDRCIQIRRSNFEIFEPNQYAAPAACIQTFLNGAVGVRLPLPDQWTQAYLDDAETAAIIGFVQNPGTTTTKSLEAAKLSAPPYASRRLFSKMASLFYKSLLPGLNPMHACS